MGDCRLLHVRVRGGKWEIPPRFSHRLNFLNGVVSGICRRICQGFILIGYWEFRPWLMSRHEGHWHRFEKFGHVFATAKTQLAASG